MEATLVIIGIVIIVFMLVRQKDEIVRLRNGLGETFDQLMRIQSAIENLKKEPQPSQPVSDPEPEIIVVEKEPEPAEPPVVQEEVPTFIAEEPQPYPQLPPLPVEQTPTDPILSASEQEIPETPIVEEEEKLSWFAQFRQNNPDIEKFIGENLINKIGIVILVLGISFFVKYAIDRDWINEPARVGIGILCGGILLGVAHRLRLLYKAFSSVLVAGAVAVFYFTIGIAFHDYHLFSQTTAFILMVVITLFSIFVSIAYDRQELGVLSFIGGFAVPFMVSTGDGNYHVLFTYLAILNVGMLIVSYFKRWFIVNFTAFVLTTILFGGWYMTKYLGATHLMLQHSFIYCSVFYILFSIAFVLNNIVRKNKFANYEIAALIANTAVYYTIGHHVFSTIAPHYTGLFTILAAAYNIIFAFIIYKKYQFDRNVIYVLIGLALTLATITIPVQFNGNYITIFWACEAVLLFWLTKKSQLKGFTFAGIIVQLLAIISLAMDLGNYIDNTVPYILFWNRLFLTDIVLLGSLVATYKLFKLYDYRSQIIGLTLNPVDYRKFMLNVAIFLGYVLPLIEIGYQADAAFANSGTVWIFLYLYHMLYTSALLLWGVKDIENRAIMGRWLTGANMLLYILIAHRIPLMESTNNFYHKENANFPYAMLLHYISLALLAYQSWFFTIKSAEGLPIGQFKKKYLLWFIAFLIVFTCSAEVNIAFLFNATSWEHYSTIRNFVMKVIFPILWGVLSFGFLLFGIRKSTKPVRIIALTLLGITILKLFLYDIQDVSETGKIIAFILLGVLILIISFVYQKIKKLIVDDHEKDSE